MGKLTREDIENIIKLIKKDIESIDIDIDECSSFTEKNKKYIEELLNKESDIREISRAYYDRDNNARQIVYLDDVNRKNKRLKEKLLDMLLHM